MKNIVIALSISCLILFSCSKGDLIDISSDTEITGFWVFEGYRTENGVTTPCEPNDQAVTLDIELFSESYKGSGKSFVNSYQFIAKIDFLDEENNGRISIDGIGTTKMAGPPHLMECENVYYDNLKTSAYFNLKDSKLYLSRVSHTTEFNPEIPVLVFKRK